MFLINGFDLYILGSCLLPKGIAVPSRAQAEAPSKPSAGEGVLAPPSSQVHDGKRGSAEEREGFGCPACPDEDLFFVIRLHAPSSGVWLGNKDFFWKTKHLEQGKMSPLFSDRLFSLL